MRKLGKAEIDDIARGAALLGAGGGGDPISVNLLHMVPLMIAVL